MNQSSHFVNQKNVNFGSCYFSYLCSGVMTVDAMSRLFNELLKRLQEFLKIIISSSRQSRVKPLSGTQQMQGDHQFAQTILDSLSAHVAILDSEGYILETNQAWKLFAEQNRLQQEPPPVPTNYLEVCENSGVEKGEYAFIAQGIRDVISGVKNEFALDYPCHSHEEKRWFFMRVVRASGPGPLRIVVSHENITALKLAQEQMDLHKQELLLEKRRLEEANTALKVLLQRREADRRELEENVLDNIRQLVIPVSEQLAALDMSVRARNLLATLDMRLTEVTKPFLQRVSDVSALLTPQEIEVAALIREGLTSKAIAERLNISLTTVNFHRRNLRRKLQLKNTRANLRSYLIGLAE